MRLVEGVAAVEDLDAFLTDLDEIARETGCTVQAFDARYVMGRTHLERAVERADRAIERGENVARDRGMEIMLYAAGRRQINRALTMGIGEGERPAVVLADAGGRDEQTEEPTAADGPEAEATAADRIRDLLEPAETLGTEYADHELVREFYDVSEAELDAAAGDLESLVLERVALLDVEK